MPSPRTESSTGCSGIASRGNPCAITAFCSLQTIRHRMKMTLRQSHEPSRLELLSCEMAFSRNCWSTRLMMPTVARSKLSSRSYGRAPTHRYCQDLPSRPIVPSRGNPSVTRSALTCNATRPEVTTGRRGCKPSLYSGYKYSSVDASS
jgi:hypothetical protein